MSEQRKPQLLKKSQVARILNISGKTLEKKLNEGLFPPPSAWVSASPQGRRWAASDIYRVFGIDVPLE